MIPLREYPWLPRTNIVPESLPRAWHLSPIVGPKKQADKLAAQKGVGATHWCRVFILGAKLKLPVYSPVSVKRLLSLENKYFRLT